MIAQSDELMVLNDLTEVLRAIDRMPTRIEHATASSRDARAGSLFLAYPGAARDGRRFIADAVARGVSAVAFEAGDADSATEPFVWREEWKVPHIAVRNLKQFASAIGGHVYGHPANALWMVGVTGTNGKTSVSQWSAQALSHAGQRSAVMGTIGNGLVGELAPAENTTPDALVMQRSLRAFVDAGATCCAMEVSSHGLDQGRVADLKYDVAVFTNLTRDHLDYHGTMEAYGEAKARLFAMRGLKTAVINLDDAFGRELVGRILKRGADVIGYRVSKAVNTAIEHPHATLTARDVAVSAAGLSFVVDYQANAQGKLESVNVESGVLGAFNVGNMLAVVGVLLASGVALARAAEIVAELQPVAGRMQTVRAGARASDKPLVVVDYAHTPDALEKALSTVAATVPPKGKLICVFGCGGDRDRGKRPLMGEIAARYADLVVVTSDNPRTEEPTSIIRDIEAGISKNAGTAGTTHLSIVDRHQAIFEALNRAAADDIVLIAGKGHEDYQIIGEHKQHFSDVEVAADALAVWKGAQ
ncbi:MAG: UDP-N-acetylmuramoyl-L-alanyl-D-glutamate--2,6-diaminopimelate ligase [Nitrosomonadaceae bacterium]|jgi:UDP-N-acetylmuramoyl-L-alanyl-D-glutamate--2,6-diaminopimelate ligase|nr:UDP-N-acetylmuramoyl-L-alanyl-D-glutamate--2,6-diaminopimelate ligase [Nitrosomonadaceae bacterium]